VIHPFLFFFPLYFPSFFPFPHLPECASVEKIDGSTFPLSSTFFFLFFLSLPVAVVAASEEMLKVVVRLSFFSLFLLWLSFSFFFFSPFSLSSSTFKEKNRLSLSSFFGVSLFSSPPSLLLLDADRQAVGYRHFFPFSLLFSQTPFLFFPFFHFFSFFASSDGVVVLRRFSFLFF